MAPGVEKDILKRPPEVGPRRRHCLLTAAGLCIAGELFIGGDDRVAGRAWREGRIRLYGAEAGSRLLLPCSTGAPLRSARHTKFTNAPYGKRGPILEAFSSVPPVDHVASCTSTGGSTAWRSASPY
jgi:hypothetical protein